MMRLIIDVDESTLGDATRGHLTRSAGLPGLSVCKLEILERVYDHEKEKAEYTTHTVDGRLVQVMGDWK